MKGEGYVQLHWEEWKQISVVQLQKKKIGKEENSIYRHQRWQYKQNN